MWEQLGMRVARPSTGRVVGIPTADLMNIQHQRSTFLLRHSLQAKLSSDNGRLAFPYAEVNSAHLVCVTHMRSRRPLSKLRDQYSRFTLSPRCNQYETLCKSTTISSLSSNMRFICESNVESPNYAVRLGLRVRNTLVAAT